MPHYGIKIYAKLFGGNFQNIIDFSGLENAEKEDAINFADETTLYHQYTKELDTFMESKFEGNISKMAVSWINSPILDKIVEYDYQDCNIMFIKNNYVNIIEWLFDTFEEYKFDCNITWCFLTASEEGNLYLVKYFYNIMKDIHDEIASSISTTYFPDICLHGFVDIAEWCYAECSTECSTECGDSKPTLTSNDRNDTFSAVCHRGHIDMAKWLLSKFPTIDVSAYNYRAFRDACYKARLNVAKWLYETFSIPVNKVIKREDIPMILNNDNHQFMIWFYTLIEKKEYFHLDTFLMKKYLVHDNIEFAKWYSEITGPHNYFELYRECCKYGSPQHFELAKYYLTKFEPTPADYLEHPGYDAGYMMSPTFYACFSDNLEFAKFTIDVERKYNNGKLTKFTTQNLLNAFYGVCYNDKLIPAKWLVEEMKVLEHSSEHIQGIPSIALIGFRQTEKHGNRYGIKCNAPKVAKWLISLYPNISSVLEHTRNTVY